MTRDGAKRMTLFALLIWGGAATLGLAAGLVGNFLVQNIDEIDLGTTFNKLSGAGQSLEAGNCYYADSSSAKKVYFLEFRPNVLIATPLWTGSFSAIDTRVGRDLGTTVPDVKQTSCAIVKDDLKLPPERIQSLREQFKADVLKARTSKTFAYKGVFTTESINPAP